MDFKLNIDHGGDIKILQLTDMQVIDASQQRYAGRLTPPEDEWWADGTQEKNLYSHIRYLVDKTKPDLIIITGDITYGQFDDSGKSLLAFIDFMDSFQIPWAPAYGNHDNECYLGADWQNEQYENSKYALFTKGTVSGNGNYSIGIYQGGELVRLMLMLDSHGCNSYGKEGLVFEPGIYEDQREWASKEASEAKKINPDVKTFMCFHIPTKDFCDALVAAGYQKTLDLPEGESENFAQYEIGVDVEARDGEFGRKFERVGTQVERIMPLIKECDADGLFAGHLHKVNTSVMYEGVRFTLGYKTGFYDYHDKDANGGTLITLCGSDFTVKHIGYQAK